MFTVELAQTSAKNRSQKRAKEPPDMDDWLSKRVKRTKTDDSPTDIGCTESSVSDAPLLPKFELPVFLRGINNLPPSVLPPPQECLQGSGIQGWG